MLPNWAMVTYVLGLSTTACPGREVDWKWSKWDLNQFPHGMLASQEVCYVTVLTSVIILSARAMLEKS